MNRFEDKVALVTGGASGIGAATARRLASEGARVVIADINAEGAAALAAELGDAALAVSIDAERPETIEAAVDATVERFARLDVLHNNAALTSPDVLMADTNAVDIDLALFDRVIAVNLRGYVAGCKYAIPAMRVNGGGAIVCTSSGAALQGDVTRLAYGCSKGAVNTLVKYVATQHAHEGIRCNAVAPGLVQTPGLLATAPELIDLMRRHMLTEHVEADDIAALVAFLASDESRHLTGQVLSYDAGYSAHQAAFADLASLMAGNAG